MKLPPSSPIVCKRGREARRGSVIIFVLGVILLTSFLIVRLMDRAAVELAAESKASSKTAMRQEAYSALEASLAVIADYAAVDNGLHAVEQGWERPLEIMNYTPGEGFKVDATVEDETGKLSLPAADETVLRGYLDAIGCPATSLDKLVESLMVWTKENYVPQGVDLDAENFAGSALPYKAPQRSLRSFEELRAIPACRETFFDKEGHWNELGGRFMAGASLFQFASSNVNSARPEGLLALGLGVAQIESLVTARDVNKSNNSFYRAPGEMAGVLGKDTTPPAGLGADAICLHLTIRVRQGSRDYRLEAWVSPAGSAAISTPAPATALKATLPTDTTPPIPAKRTSTRNKVDSPFQILELRENNGT
jgi:general secretion pathway protein K